MFENKKIFILGMARSGYEAAKFLSQFNNEIIVSDGKEQDEQHVKELQSLGVKVIITDNQEDLIDASYDYVIKNPGIKYDNKCVIKAKNLNIKVINELEMAYSFINKNVKIIGVTGSNGKTTTVTLIYEFLKSASLPVHLCGNIGFPLSSMLNDIKDGDILVVEISDHQLCDMYDFKTDISVLTNISETHIDFHDSYERYKSVKKRIFNNHTNDDIAVLNLDNNEVLNITEDINSLKYYFSKESNEKCYLDNNIIYYDNKPLIKLNDVRLKGIHNYENIMASIIVCKEFNVSDDIIKNVLLKFAGVEHRLEYVSTINGRLFYNDSKSTNNQATITALKSFNTPVILIMGGLDRNIPFDDLYPYMKNVKKIVCYGETKEKLNSFANKYSINCSIFDNLKDSIIDAYNCSKEGDVILLSPACASWDQYKCFEDRGNEFKNIVNGLK